MHPADRTRALVARHLPGWRVVGQVSSESGGALCQVERMTSERGYETRTVWVDETGAVDAEVNDLGYIVTQDGRKL